MEFHFPSTYPVGGWWKWKNSRCGKHMEIRKKNCADTHTDNPLAFEAFGAVPTQGGDVCARAADRAPNAHGPALPLIFFQSPNPNPRPRSLHRRSCFA